MAIASSIIASIIAAGAATGSTVIGARTQAGAARRAGDIQSRTTDQAFAYERDQDRLEREQYDREYQYKLDQDRYARERDEERRRYEAEDRLRSEEERARRDALDQSRINLDSELGRGRLNLDKDQQAWTFKQRADLLNRMAPYRQFGEQGMRRLQDLL